MSKQQEFNEAVMKGDIRIVNFLINDPDVDPSVGRSKLLRYASQKGYNDIVNVLLKDSRVNPSLYRNYALRESLKNDNLCAVKTMLQH